MGHPAHPGRGRSFAGDAAAIGAVAARQNGHTWAAHLTLRRAGARLRDDAEVVLAAATHFGCALAAASERLLDNEAIVRAAYVDDPYSLAGASQRLRQDPTFLASLAELRPSFHLVHAAADGATLSPQTLRRLAPLLREGLAEEGLSQLSPEQVAEHMELPPALIRALLASWAPRPKPSHRGSSFGAVLPHRGRGARWQRRTSRRVAPVACFKGQAAAASDMFLPSAATPSSGLSTVDVDALRPRPVRGRGAP